MANESLNLKSQELRSINEKLRNFVFMANRDVSEQLGKIQLYSNELLNVERSIISEKGIAYGKKILNSVRSMAVLIDGTFEFLKTNPIDFSQSKQNNPGNFRVTFQRDRRKIKVTIKTTRLRSV